MNNLIAVKKVEDTHKINDYVGFVLKKIDWKKSIKGKTIFLKINAMSAELAPGRNTGPWIVDALLKILTSQFPGNKIYLGDTNLAGAKQFSRAIQTWGYDTLCKKYGVEIVNLDTSPLTEVNMRGKILKKMLLPKIIVQADTIINVPVMKTHSLTLMTCCLKNLWGLLPRARHQYHPFVNEVIADINHFFVNRRLNIVDATISMEGPGPKIGIPRISNVIFVGTDPVACDSFACDLMGLDKREIKQIYFSEKFGVGQSKYKIIGDHIHCLHFRPSVMKNDPASFIETTLRKVPVVTKIIFQTPLVHMFGFLGTQYNYYVSYLLKGQKNLSEDIIYRSPYSFYLKKIYKIK